MSLPVPSPSAYETPARRRADVVALILGLAITAIAGAALWRVYLGPLNWHLIKIVAPFTLVAIGVVGLALSRNRSQS